MRKIYNLNVQSDSFIFNSIIHRMLIFNFIFLTFFSCSEVQQSAQPSLAIHQEVNIQTDFNLSDFFKESSDLDIKVDSIFNSLSDGQRVSQMIMTSGGDQGKPIGTVRGLVRDGIAGGVIKLGGSADNFAASIDELNGLAQSNGQPALIFSTDAEPSLINRKIRGITQYKNTNQISSEEEAYKTGADIAKEIWAIGFDYNFAPVCDISLNKEIIGNRSFGSDVNTASLLSAAFIKGTQDNNVIATAKHFPGHGNVTGDSHNRLVTINGEMLELDIFRAAIDAGVISIMIGHIEVSNNEYGTNGLPSTMSRRIVTELLREQMNFQGIIITDAMNMGALNKFKNASLEAVKAGCDIILMEPDERKLHSQIISLLKSDDKFKEQVYTSVKRVLRAKICLGLI